MLMAVGVTILPPCSPPPLPVDSGVITVWDVVKQVLSWDIIIVFLLVALFKAVRDNDDWVYSWTIFDGHRFWEWLHVGWDKWTVLSIWHLADGAIVTGGFAYIYWLKYPGQPWWSYALAVVSFWLLFYRVFNFLYHFALRKPQFRDWWQRRKF